MILSIAWKNIWRSKLRSAVVIVAVGCGLLAGVFSVGLMNGMVYNRLDAGINTEVGSLQLHRSEYMENSEPQYTITQVNQIMTDIRQNPEVAAVSKRFKTECMLSSNRSATGLNIVGIVPEEEKKVSLLYQYINDTNGTYLSDKGRNPIIISTKTAEKLKVHLRNKIIVSGVSKDGLSTQASFRVVGIYKTNNGMFDNANAFIRFSDAIRLFGFDEDEAHEIVILNKEFNETEGVQKQLQSKHSRYCLNEQALLRARNDSIPQDIYTHLEANMNTAVLSKDEYQSRLEAIISEENHKAYEENLLRIAETGINVTSWNESSPDLAMMATWVDLMLFTFVGIILLALGFGIVNTMLMVVLERTKELGMLMAIGMNRKKVFRMILTETVLLSLTGGVVGMILSLIAILHFQQTGLDLTAFAEGFESMGYASIIYPEISIADYIKVTIMVIITGILASIYPARKATQLIPAEAVRSE